MKVMNIENPEEFLKVIDACEGQVELVTADGDRLNLKSKLCQLISLTTIFSSSSAIPEMEIIAHEADDSKRIIFRGSFFVFTVSVLYLLRRAPYVLSPRRSPWLCDRLR